MKINNAAVVIPSRLGSTRLPKKPLIKIGDLTMIEQAVVNALDSDVEKVYVTTDSPLISDLLNPYPIEVIIVNDECKTGTDRVFLATQKAGIDQDVIINLQGDMPFMDPSIITKVAKLALESDFDICTAVSKKGLDYAQNKSNVKVVVGADGKALYFSRSLIPHNTEEYLCHVGIYAYKKQALKKFHSLPQSDLEKLESLEQLRAMENGMSIGVCYVDNMPVSVDTQEDLDYLLTSLQNVS